MAPWRCVTPNLCLQIAEQYCGFKPTYGAACPNYSRELESLESAPTDRARSPAPEPMMA